MWGPRQRFLLLAVTVSLLSVFATGLHKARFIHEDSPYFHPNGSNPAQYYFDQKQCVASQQTELDYDPKNIMYVRVPSAGLKIKLKKLKIKELKALFSFQRVGFAELGPLLNDLIQQKIRVLLPALMVAARTVEERIIPGGALDSRESKGKNGMLDAETGSVFWDAEEEQGKDEAEMDPDSQSGGSIDTDHVIYISGGEDEKGVINLDMNAENSILVSAAKLLRALKTNPHLEEDCKSLIAALETLGKEKVPADKYMIDRLAHLSASVQISREILHSKYDDMAVEVVDRKSNKGSSGKRGKEGEGSLIQTKSSSEQGTLSDPYDSIFRAQLASARQDPAEGSVEGINFEVPLETFRDNQHVENCALMTKAERTLKKKRRRRKKRSGIQLCFGDPKRKKLASSEFTFFAPLAGDYQLILEWGTQRRVARPYSVLIGVNERVTGTTFQHHLRPDVSDQTDDWHTYEIPVRLESGSNLFHLVVDPGEVNDGNPFVLKETALRPVMAIAGDKAAQINFEHVLVPPEPLFANMPWRIIRQRQDWGTGEEKKKCKEEDMEEDPDSCKPDLPIRKMSKLFPELFDKIHEGQTVGSVKFDLGADKGEFRLNNLRMADVIFPIDDWTTLVFTEAKASKFSVAARPKSIHAESSGLQLRDGGVLMDYQTDYPDEYTAPMEVAVNQYSGDPSFDTGENGTINVNLRKSHTEGEVRVPQWQTGAVLDLKIATDVSGGVQIGWIEEGKKKEGEAGELEEVPSASAVLLQKDEKKKDKKEHFSQRLARAFTGGVRSFVQMLMKRAGIKTKNGLPIGAPDSTKTTTPDSLIEKPTPSARERAPSAPSFLQTGSEVLSSKGLRGFSAHSGGDWPPSSLVSLQSDESPTAKKTRTRRTRLKRLATRAKVSPEAVEPLSPRTESEMLEKLRAAMEKGPSLASFDDDASYMWEKVAEETDRLEVKAMEVKSPKEAAAKAGGKFVEGKDGGVVLKNSDGGAETSPRSSNVVKMFKTQAEVVGEASVQATIRQELLQKYMDRTVIVAEVSKERVEEAVEMMMAQTDDPLPWQMEGHDVRLDVKRRSVALSTPEPLRVDMNIGVLDDVIETIGQSASLLRRGDYRAFDGEVPDKFRKPPAFPPEDLSIANLIPHLDAAVTLRVRQFLDRGDENLAVDVKTRFVFMAGPGTVIESGLFGSSKTSVFAVLDCGKLDFYEYGSGKKPLEELKFSENMGDFKERNLESTACEASIKLPSGKCFKPRESEKQKWQEALLLQLVRLRDQRVEEVRNRLDMELLAEEVINQSPLKPLVPLEDRVSLKGIYMRALNEDEGPKKRTAKRA
uniref:GOLD domain-containing protein n=1 Tax=Chromera velia CCMP2878 TaxID=1169474 RepID=A0A0G4GI78_9ALVE|eukprot:Cvel_21951.t1-p1 / transcript=Cvel_21951.t1 / gene=Cvel_21951 / organism=Chromera_velia_CCMP2878 / gene_product=hypothetical protein / transcript_product=hypothetical protein / location=Cvel_scaffold2108:800-13178(-) / protein_length=1318 / sequence_SO=supercontig / SO=protein_coding / is_pseudo=false